MGRDELDAAARKSVSGFKKFREHLLEVLIRRIVAIVGDAAAPVDVLTVFFPPAARKNETYSNSEFNKIIMSLLNVLYELNALKAKEERPFILQAKVQLDVTSLDVLDVSLLAVGRTALHQGRSEASKSFFQLFALYLTTAGASMELEVPGAPAPALGAGAGSAYFAVLQKIRASKTGKVAREPSASVHLVERHACLYVIATMFRQAMVLKPFVFPPVALHAGACSLRGILVARVQRSSEGADGQVDWTTEAHKDAEKRSGPGVWSLLMPMTERRPELLQKIQALTPTECQELQGSNTEPPLGDSSAGGPANAEVGSTVPPQPSWLEG